MTRTDQNQQPFCLLPTGWNDAWLQAKARSVDSPAWITVLGDSVEQGQGSTNTLVNGWVARLRAALLARYPLFGDFFAQIPFSPDASPVTGSSPWSNTGAGTVFLFGWGKINFSSQSQVQLNYFTFTSPYPCVALDIIYMDYQAGTWQYSVDGGAAQTVTNTGAGTTPGAVMKKISITGLAPGIHTIAFGNAVGANVMSIMGCSCYASVQNGIGFANNSTAGIQAFDYQDSTKAPADKIVLWQGTQPNGVAPPAAPAAAPTLAAPSAGGAITLGTHYYAVTFTGAWGETAIGTASALSTIAAGGTQTVALSAIPLGGPPVATRKIYRTKAGAPIGGPYYYLATIPDNTTTTFSDTVADGALGAQSPAAAVQLPTGFGFPTQPHLLIIALGINDINNAQSVATVQNAYRRLIQAARRGRPNCSILFLMHNYPDGTSSDFTTTSGNNWYQFKEGLLRIAQAYNCGYADIDAKWGEWSVTNGLITSVSDVHPTDAGHADIAQLVGALV